MPPRTPKEPGLKLVGTQTTKKPAAAKSAAAKPGGKARDAKPAAAKARKPAPADKGKSEMLKLRDLADSVAAATGTNKKDARLAVEATLDAMAVALKRGDDLNLPPLGRARVAKSSDKDGTTTLTLKLRLHAAEKPGVKQTLADDGEDS